MSKHPSPPRTGRPSRKAGPSSSAPRPPLETRHKILLAVIGVVFGIVLIGGTELVLRAVHYGPDLREFVPRQILGRKYWELNRDFISLRYFPKEMAKEPGFARFPADKAPDTYRIFSMGESSTQGDPYGPQASFSAFLEEMLQDLHPDKKIEVINCGIVAISSADVLDLLPEIMRHQPDAILLYVGHNEAYGADGVLSGIRGTLTSREWMKLRIKARNSRIGFLLRGVTHKVRSGSVAPKTQGFGMELMEGKVLRHESKLHRQMLEVYRGNLQEMIDLSRKHGADVILCTCAANLRDQSPMGSAHRRSLSAADQARWQEAFEAGKKAMAAGQWDQAAASLRQAVQIDSCYSEARFRLARCLDARTRGAADSSNAEMDQARRQYRGALDEDIVHFRACSDENRVVRELAARNGGHVVLVDLEKDLAEASPANIPGREFMTEHVHPYTRGHAFLAERICRDMAGSEVGSKLGPWDFSRLRPVDDYLARMGLTDWDEAVGLLLTVQHKLNKWPFPQAYENRQATQYLQGQIRELAKTFTPMEAQVFSEIQAGRFNTGYDYGLRHQEVGRRAMTVQDVPLAVQEFKRCERYWGPMAEVTANLAQAHLLGNDLAPVDSLLDAAALLDPKLARVHFLRGMLRKSESKLAEARTEFQIYLKLEPASVYAAATRQILAQMGR